MKVSCLIKPNIANRKGGNCFGKMNFAVTFCCTLMPNEGFWCHSYDHCVLCVNLSPQALILFFYSWKVTNPIPQKDKTFLKYHMIIISISGTHLCSRGMNNLPRGGQNQEWSPYSAWRLDDYLVPGCWRPAGGRYRYCFVCLTSLTTGLVQVVSCSPTCVIHQALRSSPWGLVYLKLE